MKLIEKICIWVFYAGVTITLVIPLLVDNRFFFPFISTKIFLFRIVVEAMLLTYLILVAVNMEYRPRFNVLTLLLTAFVAVAAAASWLGPDFYVSFWGNMERGEGLISWLHLWAYLVMLISFVRSEKAWQGFLDVSLAAGAILSLFAVGQALKLSFLLNTSGSRADATFGNAAFLAGYMMFEIAFASYLFWRRPSVLARCYYGALAALFFWVIIATETRGAALGLVAGVVVAAILFAIAHRKNSAVVRGAVIVLVVLFGSWGVLFVARNQPWVHDSSKLRSLVSISFTERTAETRFASWSAAWEGVKEKPVLGWGLENFGVVFNKNFPPIIYEDEGSQVWFDRAHNLLFDRVVTTGIVGLILYLAFLLYPAYFLLKRRLSDPAQHPVVILVASLTVAFIVQDLFVFEAVPTYLILFFTWAFFGAVLLADDRELRPKLPEFAWTILAVGFAIALVPVLYTVNLYPAQINMAAAKTLHLNPQEEDFFNIVDSFKEVLEAPTYGRQEYRIQFIEFIDQQLANIGEVVEKVKPVLQYADNQVELQMSEYPNDAKNFLLAMRHYNYTNASLPDQRIQRIEKALSIYPKLDALSPTRPQTHQEAGYSHLYLYRIYKENNELALAGEHLASAEALFKKSIDLNPDVVESHTNLVMLYLNSQQYDKIQQTVDVLAARGPKWLRTEYLNKLNDLSKSNKSYEWVRFFSAKLTEQNPDNVNAWIDQALAYAYLGNRTEAIKLADKIKEFGRDYEQQAETFIANVKSGYYEKNR